MAKAKPDRRGDFDASRNHDSLIYRVDGVRAAMFINEMGDIGCAVDQPNGSASTFSIDPADLIEWLRQRATGGQQP